jgi:hypothetical protein
MALSNAERQRQFRKRRDTELQLLEQLRLDFAHRNAARVAYALVELTDLDPEQWGPVWGKIFDSIEKRARARRRKKAA